MKTDMVRLPNGGVYFGNVSDSGLPEGTNGIGIWKDQKRKYIGSWCEGKLHGRGEMHYLDSNKKVYGIWYCDELLYEFKKTGDAPNDTNDIIPSKRSDIVALLVGNCNYSKKLNNCIEDTKEIEKKLKGIGMDVIRIEDASKNRLNQAVDQLCAKSGLYKHALFFFSGHGCTYQGLHFIQTIPDVYSDSDMVCLEEISAKLKAANFTNKIIIEDACNSIISVDRGPMPSFPLIKFSEDVGGTLMAFATGLGEPSSDGICGKHSPYALALLEYIDLPNIGLLEMFNCVYEFVLEYSTKVLLRPQEPWVYHQHISPNFSLNPQ